MSLWSGAGGFDLGLQQAGFDVILGADSDEWACRTHGHNSGALVFQRDLDDPEQTRRWLRELELPPVALLAGGFPCQPYSRAGRSIIRHLVANRRRDATDPRAFAWRTFVAAVDELRPRRAIAENVPDLARFNDGQLLRDIVESLEELGYEVDARVLPARLFGVPQFRERLFIQAAEAGEEVRWPQPGEGEIDAARLDLAIRDLPEIVPGAPDEPMRYSPSPGNPPPAWAREECDGPTGDLLYDHVAREVRADDLRAFELLEPGGTYLDIPKELRRYDDESFTDKYKRLAWESPSRTITAHIARDGYWYIHPEAHRTLSIREAARVQTFPDWYVFAGFPSNRYTQVGNAVPPLLGRAVGEALLGQGRPMSRSTVPAAAASLAHAAETRPPASDWAVVVSESLLSGRAGGARLAEALVRFPEPEAALGRRRSTPEEKKAARAAAVFLDELGGTIPGDPEAVGRLPSVTPATAELIVSITRGERPPVGTGTLRVADRVAGISRTGSLNGVSHVALARLASFGADAGVNRLLLDIARSICRPSDPRCSECPLAGDCASADGESASQLELVAAV